MRVTVTVDPNENMDAVTTDLRDAGLQVDHVLRAIGCVVGAIDPQLLPTLRAIPGVRDVSQEISFKLPDPSSPVQ